MQCINELLCIECGSRSDRDAIHWEAHLAGRGDDGDEIALYCPSCAAREFHSEQSPLWKTFGLSEN